jgi:citrate lyase subunit beta/citryl-CoA lyase
MNDFAFGTALLFCPADRPERYSKALERSDAVILDLEDAVLPEAKRAARGHLIDMPIDPERVIVRVNPIGSQEFDADIRALSQTDYRTIMIAKAESAKALRSVDQRFELVALCETARGVMVADRLAAVDKVVALMWGAEDLTASIGGTSSRDDHGKYRDAPNYARARILLAAGSRGKAAIDSVYLDLDDTVGLSDEARDAAASGFDAKACIHPAQVPIVREAYAPTPEQLSWAADVLKAAESEHGVFRYNGVMVDEPVLRHARSLLGR